MLGSVLGARDSLIPCQTRALLSWILHSSGKIKQFQKIITCDKNKIGYSLSVKSRKWVSELRPAKWGVSQSKVLRLRVGRGTRISKDSEMKTSVDYSRNRKKASVTGT